MNDKKVIWFSAFRYIVPADYEKMLEKMAAEGWHTGHFRQWSSICMTLTRGEPKKYRFVYDPQVSPRKDYISTYEQFGWKYLSRMASAHFWRMEYSGERPEAFSDKGSVVERNKRTLSAASVSFFLFLAADLFFAGMLIFSPNLLSKGDRTQIILVEIFFCIITVLLGVVLLVLRKNQKR